MKDGSKFQRTKTACFLCVSVTAVVLGFIAVQPLWLAWVLAALLLPTAALGYSMAPAGTGHVPDGIVQYTIAAFLMILLAVGVGRAFLG